MRGSQLSGSPAKRRCMTTKMPVTVRNWITSGTAMPYSVVPFDPPVARKIPSPTSSVIATLMVRTFAYVGNSSGPMSCRPKVTDRSSPRYCAATTSGLPKRLRMAACSSSSRGRPRRSASSSIWAAMFSDSSRMMSSRFDAGRWLPTAPRYRSVMVVVVNRSSSWRIRPRAASISARSTSIRSSRAVPSADSR